MSLKSFLKNVRWLWKDGVEERLRDDIIARIFYEIRPKIKNHRETIDRLVETKQSIARFGDGEIAIIQGGSIPFQKYEKRLAERLRSILKNDNPNLLVGVNYEYFYPPQANMIEGVSSFYKNCAKTFKKALLPCLDLNTQYYSAGFTQLSMFFSDYDFNSHYERLRQIWGGGGAY